MIGIELDIGPSLKFLQTSKLSVYTELSTAIETVGRRLESDGKKNAPVVEGNLRRSIKYKHFGTHGEVRANANYSAYVHGAPFHHSSRMRRTTPFFTIARDNNKQFAEKTLEKAVKKAIALSARKSF